MLIEKEGGGSGCESRHAALMLFDGFMEDRSRGSVEDVAEFGEDAFFDGVAGLEVGLVAEGLEGGFFAFVEVLGNVDHYVDKLVAGR